MISLVNKLKQKQGFTLIELMIVVAIIGILAAIAIPNFMRYQLRVRAGEGKLNLSAIRTAQEAYFAEAGTFVAWQAFPNLGITSQKQIWCAPGAAAPPCCPAPLPLVPPNTPPAPTLAHCYIGWEPEGDVYYDYQVVVNGFPANQFWAASQSDIDGDGILNVWGIDKPNIQNVSLGGGPFGCTNVLNKQTGVPMIHQVGPCDSTENGLSIF